MRRTILFVEDDESIAAGVGCYLRDKGFTVHTSSTAEESKRYLSKQLPDLIILDWNLPDSTGDLLCQWIKESWKEIPIIYLTVRGDKRDILQGFLTGADDYIVKPFDLEVLDSRIRAILRRTGSLGGNTLLCGSITVDKIGRKVLLHRKEVILSSIEYQLLVMLMENKNHTLTRGRLLEVLWDSNGCFVNDNTLTVTMKRLREKLENPDCIKTLRSLGYRMEDME